MLYCYATFLPNCRRLPHSPPHPPPPPPPPTPTPSKGPYEDPPCASGEEAVQVQGLSGSFCSPACTGGIFSKHCVAPPTGVTAQAKCILEKSGSSSPTNCALICSGDSECPSGASCQSIQGTGLCLYPESTKAAAAVMSVVEETSETSLVMQAIRWLKNLF